MFFIVDDHGELIGKFPTREAAEASLEELHNEDPLSHEECAIVEIDERTGRRLGSAALRALSA